MTNTTSRPRNSLVDKLAGFGIGDGYRSHPHAAGGSGAMVQAPPSVRVRPLCMSPKRRAEFAALRLADDDVGAVIVGDLGREWTFDRL